MVKKLSCVPPSHGCVHVVHSDQVELQSLGHGCKLHVCSSNMAVVGHVPLFCAGTTTVRVRSRTPSPQLVLHMDQLLHGEYTHGMGMLGGHACVLHGCVAVSAPHVLPPLSCGNKTDRKAVWTPPPQLTEQRDQLPNEPSTQSRTKAEHGCVLHGMLTLYAPGSEGHATPP